MGISDLGKNVKRIREDKGWTLNKLKQESGIGYATLHDLENGKTQNLNSNNLLKVANALDMTIDDLLGNEYEVEELVVDDIEETLMKILESDELKYEGILMTVNEKGILKDYIMSGLESIKRKRK